jgi:hypothetical protein
MENIEISSLGNCVAFVHPKHLDTIYIYIPDSIVLDSETIKVYHVRERQWIKKKLINEIFSLLEHESLHIVLDKTVSVEASDKLDNPIDNETLETILYREQWLNCEV